jgi:D-glycero-alpha-D-manno-heptose 1-phosphate guanylyltransferase
MQPAQIPVLILAGGRGVRLGGATPGPKPLASVAGRPFVIHTLAALHAQGFRRVTFLTGHRAGEFEQGLRNECHESRSGFLASMELDFHPEPTPLGTGGALAAAASAVEDEALLLNADSYCEVDFRDVLALRRERGAALCLTAVEVAEAADYGGLLLEGGQVVGFVEKGLTGARWVNAGVYGLHRRFIEEALPRAVPCSLERDVLPAWIARESTPVLTTRAFFRDIGTPERLQAAQKEFPRSLSWHSRI